MDKIKQSLQNLDCDLIDRGNYYHVKAKYRDGDNPTALKVYKNSGVWKDFVEGTNYLPFELLVSKILGTKDKNVLKKYCNESHINFSSKSYKQEIETIKIYDPKILKNLDKDYTFYNKKNISNSTLEKYRCGVGSKNNFKNFMVFPVFNKFGKIHGFSGRNLRFNKDNPKSLKWMHTKDVVNFVYPCFLHEDFINSIIKTKTVYLIESIGDSLALSENRVYNHLVCFTTFINSKPLCFLASLNLERMVFSFNNDTESSKNWGLINSLKNIIRASEIFPIEKLFLKLPTKGDFGDMQQNGESITKWHNQDLDELENKQKILDLLTKRDIKDSLQIKKEDYSRIVNKIKERIFDLQNDF